MDFLKRLLIVVIAGAVGAGAVALIERLMFEAPRPAVSDEPPALPVIRKSPVQQWTWPSDS